MHTPPSTACGTKNAHEGDLLKTLDRFSTLVRAYQLITSPPNWGEALTLGASEYTLLKAGRGYVMSTIGQLNYMT